VRITHGPDDADDDYVENEYANGESRASRVCFGEWCSAAASKSRALEYIKFWGLRPTVMDTN